MFINIDECGVINYSLDNVGVEVVVTRDFIYELQNIYKESPISKLPVKIASELSRNLPPEAYREILADGGLRIWCGQGGDFHLTCIATNLVAMQNQEFIELENIDVMRIECFMGEMDKEYYVSEIMFHE